MESIKQRLQIMFINPTSSMFVYYFYPIQYQTVQQVKEEQLDIDKQQTQQIEEKQTDASGIIRGKGQLWSQEEIDNLIKYYKYYNGNWKRIIKHLRGRNISQCSQKYRKLEDQIKRTKRKWSQQEDQILLQQFSEYGKQWIKIAQQLPGRTSKQVRDRYVNQINPNLNHTKWQEYEDKLIMKEYKNIGPRWANIAQLLKSRSENQVKNRFYYTLQKQYSGELHPYLKIQK